jgi:hypothetical protein
VKKTRPTDPGQMLFYWTKSSLKGYARGASHCQETRK